MSINRVERSRSYRAACAGLAVAAVATVASAVVATPAMAGSNLCPASRVCIYTDSGFSGLLGTRSAGGGNSNLSASADNKMDSWENKTTTNAAWYDDPNGGGTCNTMLANRENSYVGFFSRNGMSSWKTNGAC